MIVPSGAPQPSRATGGHGNPDASAARLWTAEIETGTPIADRLEHDRRGHALSVELQDELGAEYDVTYLFETREVRDALLE